jgi:hypothetical protein
VGADVGTDSVRDQRTVGALFYEALKSGAQLLAAAGAAGAQNLAAADGRRAGAEAVAACAHEVRRLESALHGEVLENNKNGRP